MSFFDDDERERRRKERRDYESEVEYRVWRSGNSVDRINYDRLSDSYDRGDDYESVARREISRQNAARERKREMEQEEY